MPVHIVRRLIFSFVTVVALASACGGDETTASDGDTAETKGVAGTPCASSFDCEAGLVCAGGACAALGSGGGGNDQPATNTENSGDDGATAGGDDDAVPGGDDSVSGDDDSAADDDEAPAPNDPCDTRGEQRVCIARAPNGTGGVVCYEGVHTCLAPVGGDVARWSECEVPDPFNPRLLSCDQCKPGQTLNCARLVDGACRGGERTCESNGDVAVWSDCRADAASPEADAAQCGADCVEGERRACYDGPAGTENVGLCRSGEQVCLHGSWSECLDEVIPVAQSVCNGLDDTCVGDVDEACACQPGQTLPCYDGPLDTVNIGLCRAGMRACVNGRFGACEGQVLPSDETCDGQDHDCNGYKDDGCPATGNCSPMGATRTCQTACGTMGTVTCVFGHWSACSVNGAPVTAGNCPCTRCLPGEQRFCDDPLYCHWGTQHCGPDGVWEAGCREVQSNDEIPKDCRDDEIYDQVCCWRAGMCCQDFTGGGGNLGTCRGTCP